MEQKFGVLRTLRQTVQLVRADLMEVAGEPSGKRGGRAAQAEGMESKDFRQDVPGVFEEQQGSREAGEQWAGRVDGGLHDDNRSMALYTTVKI